MDTHPPHLPQCELRPDTVGRKHQGVDTPPLSQAGEVRLEAGRSREHRICFDDVAAQALELRREAEAQASTVVIIQVNHADALRAQHLPGVAGQLRAMTQIAGTNAEHVGIDPREIGAGSGRRDHHERASGFAIHTPRRERRARREVSNDRHHRRIIRELLGNSDGDFGTPTVVHDAQHQRPSPNSAAGIDLLYRQLGGMPHRHAAGLREGAREPEDNGSAAASTGAGSKREDRGEERPAPAHERARLSLRMG